MQLSPADLSAAARKMVGSMILIGGIAVVQHERGERKGYFLCPRKGERPINPIVIDEAVRAGVVADGNDGLFACMGQTFRPRQHVVLSVKIVGQRTDRKTGEQFKIAEVCATNGVRSVEVMTRATLKGGALKADEIKRRARQIAAGEPTWTA